MAKQLSWKLPEYLDNRGLTRYQLMQEMGGGKGRVAYRWPDLPRRIDTEVLEGVMQALERLTGEEISMTDLIVFEPTPAEDAEALLESDLLYLADTLNELESDIPQAEREAWLSAFEQADG